MLYTHIPEHSIKEYFLLMHFAFALFSLINSQKSNRIDSIVILLEIVSAFTEMFWAFAFIFLLCDSGEMVTKQFDEFDEKLFQCDWYSFPIEIQRLYLNFNLISQHSTHIQGYGGVFCTRDNFKKVILINIDSRTKQNKSKYKIISIFSMIYSSIRQLTQDFLIL